MKPVEYNFISCISFIQNGCSYVGCGESHSDHSTVHSQVSHLILCFYCFCVIIIQINALYILFTVFTKLLFKFVLRECTYSLRCFHPQWVKHYSSTITFVGWFRQVNLIPDHMCHPVLISCLLFWLWLEA